MLLAWGKKPTVSITRENNDNARSAHSLSSQLPLREREAQKTGLTLRGNKTALKTGVCSCLVNKAGAGQAP